MAVVLLGAACFVVPHRPALAQEPAASLKVVGHDDLGGTGPHVALAIAGATAVVVSNTSRGASPSPSPCATPTMTVVSARDPHRPRVTSQLPLAPAGTVVDTDARVVSGGTFRGDLVAAAVTSAGGVDCFAANDDMVVYYDVTAPDSPRLLGRTLPCPGCPTSPRSVSLVQRTDGRLLAVTVWTGAADTGGAGEVHVDDVTDPARPVPLATWSPSGADSDPVTFGCLSSARATDAEFYDEGRRAVVVLGNGHVYDLDLQNPAAPSAAGNFPPPPGPPAERVAASVTALPVRDQTVAIVSEGTGPNRNGCPSPGAPGLRLLDLDPRASVQEIADVSFGGSASPGAVVASGEHAFAPWHAAGLRVIDMGERPPRTVAQFAPAGVPDVVGAALLPDDIVLIDRTSGLYVLDRPAEGGRESFWERAKIMAAALVFAGVLSLVAVPRLLMALSFARRRSRAPAPIGVRVRRR